MSDTNEVAAPEIADATEATLAQVTSGDLSAIVPYAVNHLGPFLLMAGGGLLIVFVGYLTAKYISRIASHPICSRVDETLGKFVGNAIFYAIMVGVVGAVLSKLGAPLAGLATGAGHPSLSARSPRKRSTAWMLTG